MTPADIAASLIRCGREPQEAFAVAARQGKTTFAAVRDEYNRRQRAARVFVHSERDVARQAREWQDWQSGATMTMAERDYYRQGR